MRLRHAALVVLVLAGLGCASAPPAPIPEPPPAPEPEEPLSNTLRWSTASEVDNFGFDVFRALSEDGPFERVNEDTIAGAGTIDTPTRYEFVDTAIEPDRTYYYYVESISLQGEREQFTPIIKAPPKTAGATASGTEEPDGE
ncbi:MAG: hypothetical protein R2991_06330 [Thermoanaerobaculia bacterium]